MGEPKRPRRTGPAVYICVAPDLCLPCRRGQHDDCGWDGEPDCLCKEHPIPVREFGERESGHG